jgi:hypothetical protein
MKIRLEVFDTAGNKLKTLVNEIKEAGTYKVEFKAKDMDCGEYLYKLESTDYYKTKKMLFLK